MIKFIKLINLGDRNIYVNPANVEMIKSPIFSVHGRDANAVIVMSGKEYVVKQTPEQILELVGG